MSPSLRGLVTSTSWPHSSRTLLVHSEWVPASIAMRIGGCSETKRRLKASGVALSLPSSITSPLRWSMRHGGRSACRLCPIRLSCLVVRCYHHTWADPPFSNGPPARKSPYIHCRPSKGTAYGGSAFSSHLRRIPLLGNSVNKDKKKEEGPGRSSPASPFCRCYSDLLSLRGRWVVVNVFAIDNRILAVSVGGVCDIVRACF
jgi:hypothetical protein